MNQSLILEELFQLIERYRSNVSNRKHPVVDLKNPDELKQIIDFSVGHDGISDAEFGELMQKYLDYSVKTGSRQFMNQLFSGLNVPAFAGDVLTSLTNTSMYTYEVAPVATLIEQEIISIMCNYVGYKNGDGIFLTGGSNGNLVAMFSARNKMFPQSRFDGLSSNPRLKGFISKHAHYSFENAANILGIGAHNLVKIDADHNGQMKAVELDKAIQQAIDNGDVPFFVGATSGTTVMAAFDPLEAIGEVCRRYNVWFHADGAFGGSLIMSNKNKHFFKGSDQTDSFCWDAHKLMGIPLISSVLLVKEQGTLHFNLSDINTDYIYHNNSEVEDLGKKSIQCGRRVDAVKLWFMWKYIGRKGYEEKMDHLMMLAEYAEKIVHQNSQLELVAPRQSLTVCFRYIPQSVQNINEFNFQVRELLRKSGKNMVNVAWFGDTLAIRLITSNLESKVEDVDQFFENFMETAMQLDIGKNNVVENSH